MLHEQFTDICFIFSNNVLHTFPPLENINVCASVLLHLFRIAAALGPCQPRTAICVPVFNRVTPTHHKGHYQKARALHQPAAVAVSVAANNATEIRQGSNTAEGWEGRGGD